MPSTSPTPEPLALDARRAAALLSISPRSLWSLTAPRGPIPTVRVGGRTLYRPEDLRAYLAAHTVTPAREVRHGC